MAGSSKLGTVIRSRGVVAGVMMRPEYYAMFINVNKRASHYLQYKQCAFTVNPSIEHKGPQHKGPQHQGLQPTPPRPNTRSSSSASRRFERRTFGRRATLDTAQKNSRSPHDNQTPNSHPNRRAQFVFEPAGKRRKKGNKKRKKT